METRFHTLFKAKVMEQIDSRESSLSYGNVADFAEYKYHCGYLAGLRDALKLADDTEKEFE